jgi:hypothetical protein
MTPWLLLVAGAGLGAWLVARAFAGYGRRDPALRMLAAREVALLSAAADAAFPEGGPLPSGSQARLPAHVDRWIALLPRRNRVLIRLLLAFFEHATLLFPAPAPRGRRRFSSLAPEQRNAVLEAWGRSSLRLRRIVFTSLRTLLTSSYFTDAAVLRAIGLAPLAIATPVVEVDLLYPRIGEPRASIALGPDALRRPVDRTPLDPHGPIDPGFVPEPRP